jgi:hypothetical protein
MKKPANKETARDAFLENLKQVTNEIANDRNRSARDRNVAVANGVRLLQIEHRINPAEDADFFG